MTIRRGQDVTTSPIKKINNVSWSTRFLELKIIGSNVESLRVGGNEECEDADPPLSFFFKIKTLFESGVG